MSTALKAACLKSLNSSYNPSDVFTYKGKKVRILIDVNNNPWFRARDVCNVLEYDNNDMKGVIFSHIDVDDRKPFTNIKLKTRDKHIRKINKNKLYINEFGLYSLILISSETSEVKEFRRWITCTVLPLIRQTLVLKLKRKVLYLKDSIKNSKTQSLENININNKDPLCYVAPKTTDPDLLMALVVIKTGIVDNYCVIRCQRRNVDRQIANRKSQYPNMVVILLVTYDAYNLYNRMKEVLRIQPFYSRFQLGSGYSEEELLRDITDLRDSDLPQTDYSDYDGFTENTS
ncbi:MAG: DUF3627 domain-containing protein [Gammaproteobacteria bacterium]|nr:MAG: DUF3627 domain-containing protein [Gammaproteobacteria bacterium]